MEIKGNVMKVGAVQSGTSSNGNPWKKQDVVVEFFEYETDMWTQKIVLTLMGHNMDDYHLNVGDKVSVRFGLNMREWNDRFFQEVRLAQDGLKVISRLGQEQAGDTACTTADEAPKHEPAPQEPTETEAKADGLPF